MVKTDKTHVGSCQCEGVRYRIDSSAILTLYRCHCRECQKQSASGFGTSLKVEREGFRLERGELKTWSRPTDSGRTSTANFCAECGCRIFHGKADATVLSLKAALLDDIAKLTPIGNIWVASALPWVDAMQGVVYQGQPQSYDRLIEAWRTSRR